MEEFGQESQDTNDKETISFSGFDRNQLSTCLFLGETSIYTLPCLASI